ncbi:MAG: adenylate/guanylate cyclase domain-containing protein, partial [Candidatus Rifleibacteriota bacterium]
MKGTGRKTNQDLAGRLLPIVLLMLPLLALNGGFLFLANIEFFWQEKTGQELARQELEALTASSEFDYQLAHHAGQFLAQLEHSARMRTPEQKLKFIQSRYERIFPDPLTEGTVLAFSREENHKPFDLVFSNKEDLSAKRVFAMVFQHLVDESRNVEPGNETRRQRERLLQKLMGFGTRGDIMATSQRGKASYIIHNNRPHWFVWDYLDLGDDGMVGFMIFLKYGREHKSIGRFLALKECRKRGNGLAGFVPLLKDDKKAVLFEKLARSRLFRSWVNKNVPPIDQNLHRWVQLGFPEEQTLGNYKIFSYLGKNKTHLSVFLLPEKQRQKMPRWLWLINLSVFPFIGLLALRGILLNQWPVLNLSMRFLVLYILMASLPLSLVGIAASGYLYQFSFASQNEIAANLKNCLNQFDVRKSQIQDAYRVSAEQVFNDSILPELIKEYGLTDNRVRDRILGFFRNRPDPLPLLGFYLLDLSGKGLQYYEGTTASRLDPAFEVFKIPIVRTLRKRFAEKHPEIELPEFKVSEVQKFGELAYQSVSSNDLAAETEKRRTFPITRRLGVHTATQIHDFLTVNGKESVLIYIIWDDSSLDARTMGITRDYLGLSYPDYSFIALRKTPSGYEPVFHPGRHVDSDFLKYARTAADSASLRGGSVSRVMGKYSFLAKPSQKYSDAILVGAIDQYFFHTKMRNRLLGLALWIIVALLAVIVCVWLTSIFIVRPISEMRYALESVSAGNLSIRLKSERYDELGLLAENFSSMVKGIDDRRKLAALLSDQAIEAISGERFDAGKKLKARSFEGVALVSDIRGFTTICETMPAVRVTEMLNDHFAAMARIISLNGGRVYKFIGDAIEAIFPENENGNAADLALKAAIQMNHAVNELNLKRRREGLFQYQFGVGLGMGTFFSGQIGSEDTRIDYAVIGEPLVRAAELEACTKKCERIPVAVDEKVKNVCGDFCNFLPIDSESSGFEPSPDAARLNLVLESSRNIASSGAQTAVSDHGETFVIAGELKPAIRKTAFLLFTLFTILTVIAIVWGLSGRNEVRREAEQRNANENIFGFVEQLKSDDAARMAFEIKMKRMISRSEEKLNWDHRPNENERIRKIVEDELKGLEKIGCPDPRAIVFHYDKDNFKSPDPEKLAKTIFAKNFQADKQRLFKALACQKRNRYLKSLHTSFHRIYETKIEEMFGRDMTSEMLLHENFGSAMKI